MNARDIMTPTVFTITPDTTIREIADLLLARRISGVPVLEGERLVGIVSEGDLLRRHEIGTDRRSSGNPWWMRFFLGPLDPAEYVKSHAVRAADVMTTAPITVAEDTPAPRIAALFEKHGIKRVPVMRGQRLVGIVTRANLVQALARTARPESSRRSDGAIRSKLLEELGLQEWWHASSNALVEDGIVHFWGIYESDDARRAARVAAENIPGVRGVVDHRVNGADLPMMG
jgi:CBS domain-containing protein